MRDAWRINLVWCVLVPAAVPHSSTPILQQMAPIRPMSVDRGILSCSKIAKAEAAVSWQPEYHAEALGFMFLRAPAQPQPSSRSFLI
jgi:hypothetical protein